MHENIDELLTLCQNPSFRATFSNGNINEINLCFREKMKEGSLSSEILVKDIFRPLIKSQFKGSIDSIIKNNKLSYHLWRGSNKENKNLITMAAMLYDSCVNSYFQSKKLCKFYQNFAFLTCMHSSASQGNSIKREFFCSELITSRNQKQVQASRDIASKKEVLHSFPGAFSFTQ